MGKGKVKASFYKLGDGKVALHEKDRQRDGSELASIHEVGQFALFRLADSGKRPRGISFEDYCLSVG